MNRDYLLAQFRLIENYTLRIRSIARRTRAEFLADDLLVDAAVRQLTVLFETSHNIAKHLIASFGWRSAKSKAEAFEILAEQGVLPAEICDAFREASRFRNLVTYQTTVIDDGIVYDIAMARAGDFEVFVSHVARWLEKSESGGDPPERQGRVPENPAHE